MVGYDLALLLMGCVRLGDPRAEEVAASLLELVDEVGSWSEYYERGQPVGTRCRRWETAVSVTALVSYSRQEHSLPV